MEVRATAKHLRFSPFKGRLIADMIRGKAVHDAVGILAFTPKKSARAMKKLLESAIANAQTREGVDVDELFVKSVCVDEGRTLKRTILRSMGRANRIFKRTSHVTIILDEI
jgi:large subunit ribosomal protein L22